MCGQHCDVAKLIADRIQTLTAGSTCRLRGAPLCHSRFARRTAPEPRSEIARRVPEVPISGCRRTLAYRTATRSQSTESDGEAGSGVGGSFRVRAPSCRSGSSYVPMRSPALASIDAIGAHEWCK